MNTETLAVEDPLISMAKDNSANSVDIGFYGRYNDGSNRYLGLFSDASDSNTFNLFKGTTTEPTTTVDKTATGFDYANLILGNAYISQYLYHFGDANTYLEFAGADNIKLVAGGKQFLHAHDNGSLYLSSNNSTALTLDTSQNATFAGDVAIGDDKELIFGAASDYKIYHNSTTNVNHISSLIDRQLSLNANNIFLTNQANDSTFLHLSSTGATFAANVNMSNTSGATLNINSALGAADSKILLHEGTTASPANGASIRYDGANNLFKIGVGTNVDTTRLTIGRDTGNVTFINQVSVGDSAIPADHQFQIAHTGQSYARFGLTNSTTGNATGDGLKFQMEGLNSIIKNQEAGYLALGVNGRETDIRIVDGGKVGINYGATAPYRLSVKEDGTAATNIGVYALVNGAGTNNYAIYADANSGTSTNFGVYSNSGNNAFLGSVGIGMDAPVDKLEITGGYLKFNGGDYGLKGSASLSYNATSDHYFQSGGSTKVTFKSNGNVGIGRSPVAYGSFRVLDLAGSSGAIQKLIHTGSTVELQSYASSTVGALGTATNHPLLFTTNDTTRMQINASGKVGINETNDARTQLEVKATTSSRNTVTRVLTLNANGDSIQPYEPFGTGIIFEGFDYAGGGGTSTSRDYAYLDARIETSGSTPVDFTSRLVFATNSGGTNTTTPTTKLVIKGNGQMVNTMDLSGFSTNLLLTNLNDTDGDTAGIAFSMLDNGTYIKSGIYFERTTTQGRGDLIFAMNNTSDGQNVALADEAMRITPNKVVEIGKSTAQSNSKLDVRNNGSAIEFGHTNNGDWYFGTVGSYGSNGQPMITFSTFCEQNANTFTTKGAKGNIITSDSFGKLLFQQVTSTNTTGQNPTTVMTLYDQGRLHPSGGVFLGSSNNSNLLDDYEEGTWTPVLQFGGGTTGIAYGTQDGVYTKIGRTVHFSFRIILTSKGSSTGQATITGLPFTSANISGNYGSAVPAFANNFTLEDKFMVTIDNNSSVIRPRFISGQNYSDYTNSQFNDNTDLILTGTYQAT